MNIVSKYPYVWPSSGGFSLVAGENKIDESDIPLAAHGKLEHLSKETTKVVTDDDGKQTTVKVPGIISGYLPSAAFVSAAEQHNHKRAAARMPKVATMKTIAARDGVAPASEADKQQMAKSSGDPEQARHQGNPQNRR